MVKIRLQFANPVPDLVMILSEANKSCAWNRESSFDKLPSLKKLPAIHF